MTIEYFAGLLVGFSTMIILVSIRDLVDLIKKYRKEVKMEKQNLKDGDSDETD